MQDFPRDGRFGKAGGDDFKRHFTGAKGCNTLGCGRCHMLAPCGGAEVDHEPARIIAGRAWLPAASDQAGAILGRLEAPLSQRVVPGAYP